MDLGDELILRARAEAEQYRTTESSAPSLDAMRAECVALFEALPEPPPYRRAEDRSRDHAGGLIPGAVNLLARLYAASRTAPEGRLAALSGAVEAHVRALAAISAGDITRGDYLAREAWEAARAATSTGSFFQVGDGGGARPVFDRERGESRFDPRPEPMLTVQLFCPNEGCRRPASYSVSPRYAVHRFTCTLCRQAFTGHFAELRSAQARATGRSIHYALRVGQVGGGETTLEFDDTSGGDLAVAPRDLVVLLYAGTGTLAAVENLSTGHVLWIAPKGACFLATAAFGEDAPELDAFRDFRDRVLLPNAAGRLFVRAYYAAGPALAHHVARRPALREAVRYVLQRVHDRLVMR